MAVRHMTAEFLKDYFKATKNFDKTLQKVKILNIAKGNCLAELKLEEEHTNSLGGLHGGFSSTLVDVISSYGLISHEKCDNRPLSVSVDLHVTFLKPAKLGDEILIDTKTNRVGKNLAFCEVEILNKETKELLVKGTHTKFIFS
ncbi:acyl-coenzyme A thioesterase 13-like [Agrilus planipennis]|uniref:Acyl-coenzyme A thioesterase 13-like n=1 Tax=Agrilus planipennis TaxID=224129 RepID=A0A1W4X9W7_AGRPL|nr:acyl-coenzyme A thioesterase 13-like [Agrilus planipennis]